jgi:hypothetical protein
MSGVFPKVIIRSGSRSYILAPLIDEQIEETYMRLWRIIKYQPQSEYEYERLVNISKMWYYKNRLHCQYSKKNEKLINSF